VDRFLGILAVSVRLTNIGLPALHTQASHGQNQTSHSGFLRSAPFWHTVQKSGFATLLLTAAPLSHFWHLFDGWLVLSFTQPPVAGLKRWHSAQMVEVDEVEDVEVVDVEVVVEVDVLVDVDDVDVVRG